ncbi:Peptidyl-prolyl cis-trans isomerase, PpiC-type domain protein, partial [mine drainage metagenome]
MVPHFSAALAKLKVGQITQTPVHTRYGWHIIQLLGTRPMKAPSFAEVKTKLKQDVENKQFLAYANSLTKTAKVVTYLDPTTNKLTSGVKGTPAMPAPSAPAGNTTSA